jgi:hypothetical protein
VWNRAQKNQAQDEQAIDCNHARQVSTTGDGNPDENPGLGFAKNSRRLKWMRLSVPRRTALAREKSSAKSLPP